MQCKNFSDPVQHRSYRRVTRVGSLVMLLGAGPWLLVLLLSLQASSSAATAPGPPPDLVAAIATILARPELRGTLWGIKVADRGGAIVFEHNPDSFFVPASNKKLLAASAALVTLGPGFRFRTPLLLDEGSATVVLCGAGDPSISQQALAGAAAAGNFPGHVAGVLGRGLSNVTVLAVAPAGYDEDANPGSSSPDSWEWGDLSEYCERSQCSGSHCHCSSSLPSFGCCAACTI